MVERHKQMGMWTTPRRIESGGSQRDRHERGLLRRPHLHDHDVRLDAGGAQGTPDVHPDLESVGTYCFEEKFYRKLFFKDDKLVGAIMIRPPKSRKKLIEIMRSRLRIDCPRQELLDPANLA
jgi:hypothetical protein